MIWEDAGAPVSLAAWRMAAGIGRVGPVYTPPEHRRHGYGAAVTSAATRAVLDTGGEPILYTDLANPTSNAVYARLGYRLVGEAGIWVFGCAAGP
jgi:predicted GNAT family acetyltransferase